MVKTSTLSYASLQDVQLLAMRRYPQFIYSGELGDYLPVFTFHSLEPSDFEAKLRFLAENDYRTLTLDEAAAYLGGAGRKPPRAVVLTIDDGRLSTWTVGYPLLQNYGMCATAYVIPGYLDEGEPRPRLGETDGRGPDVDPLSAREAVDRSTVMTWSEVRHLHESGVIAIESHTMLHRRVPVSGRFTGFLGPDPRGPLYDHVKAPSDRTPWTDDSLRASWSQPLFENLPVLAADRAWAGFETVSSLCRSFVQRAGGDVVASPDWRRRLRRELWRRKPWPDGSVGLEAEQNWELSESKRVIEEMLDGKIVRHFCFPHGAGTDRTRSLALSAGYHTTAWGMLGRRGANVPGAGGHAIERLKHDFVFRLPGAGRRSLPMILTDKVRRRVGGDTGF